MIVNLFNRDCHFEEAEINELVKHLETISIKASKEIKQLADKRDYSSDTSKKEGYQQQINEAVNNWSGKVRRLGCIPLALYKIKIKTPESFYVWELNKVGLVEY